MIYKKIFYNYLDFDKIKKKIISNNKTIGLCHGVYDFLHIGHLRQLDFAKKNCDFLVVSVTHERFVDKDVRRPIFNYKDRMAMLSSLETVDYVILSDSKHADKIINFIKPNLYFKDKEYLEVKRTDVGIKKELKALKKNKGKVIFTNLQKFSSSNIFQHHYSKTSLYKKYLPTKSDLLNIIKELKKVEVNILGEFIVDKYNYTKILGIPSKASCISTELIDSLTTYGGSFAIAMHLASFVKKVNLISNLSKISLKKISKIKKKNISFIRVSNDDIVKTRFVDVINSSKILETQYFCKFHQPIIRKSIKKYLVNSKKNKYSLNIICDYGHGLIEKNYINSALSKSMNFLSLNVQVNSHNKGYNFLSQYKYSDFIALDLNELRVNFRNRYIDNTNCNPFLKKLNSHFKCPIILTLGKDGSRYYADKKTKNLPAFSNYVVDSVGAGDAYFAISTIFYFITKNLDFSNLIGSISAALATKYQGNQSYIDKDILLKNVEKFR